MTSYCGQAMPRAGLPYLSSSCCSIRPSLPTSSGIGFRRASVPDFSVSAMPPGPSSGMISAEIPVGQQPSVSCRATMAVERQVTAAPTVSHTIQTSHGASGRSKSAKVQNVDVAVVGADVAGLAVALASVQAQPGSRVMLYDSASGPPPAGDGGVLLSLNGLRALKALDAGLHHRITTELASPIHEALWFDLEGELLRRTPLGYPSSRGGGSSTTTAGQRRSALPTRPSASGGESDSSSPLIISLHDLREALAEALPEEVEVFGGHHLIAAESDGSLYTATASGSSGGAVTLRFATASGGTATRVVRAKVLVGADGPASSVKRLQFNNGHEQKQFQQPPSAQATGRVVWRGRFTLRPRDPDFARLRNFMTASRTWLDMRATHGSERTATLMPAGQNTYVWTASCPVVQLAGRGLQESGGASPYWRCLAMFEDFPEEFFATLRNTPAKAVVEYDARLPPQPVAAAASLAAPWQWFSGPVALVGGAVYSLPIDDMSSTAVNLALEDAAVLGACSAQYGLTARALQEYARQRGPRVSAMLALPPSAPERARLRDSFVPSTTVVATSALVLPPLSRMAATEDSSTTRLTSTVATALDSAAEVQVEMSSRTQPLEDILAYALKASASTPAAAGSLALPLLDAGRPSGGASRALASSANAMSQTLAQAPSGPSSPLFSRPSGARRLGPVPTVMAAVLGIMALGPHIAAAHTPASSTSAAATAAAAQPTPLSGIEEKAGSAVVSVSVQKPEQVPYSAGSTPRNVWDALLWTHGSTANVAAAIGTIGRECVAAMLPSQATDLNEYCTVGSPVAVWQALLVAPWNTYNTRASPPYNATESPALVWTALLGGDARPDAFSPLISSLATSGTDSLWTAHDDDSPGGALLPRPVLKQKQMVTVAVAQAEPASGTSDVTGFLASELQPHGTAEAAAHSQSTMVPCVSPNTTSPVRMISGLDQQRRRRQRNLSGPVSGHWAGGDRRSGSKVARGHSKSRRPAAATAMNNSSSDAIFSPSPSRSRAPSSPPTSEAKVVAAKAAATVTVSLSAAAALGGVMSAGTGHMPYDVAAAAALHAHGAVAQFWEDLNNLTLPSAGLSSIDLS